MSDNPEHRGGTEVAESVLMVMFSPAERFADAGMGVHHSQKPRADARRGRHVPEPFTRPSAGVRGPWLACGSALSSFWRSASTHDALPDQHGMLEARLAEKERLAV